MSELSPAAQAVDTELAICIQLQGEIIRARPLAAAALRAAAKHCKCDDGEGYWIYRPNILAIADELEAQ